MVNRGEERPAARRSLLGRLGARWLETVELRGLRPRDAAYVVLAFWSIGVVILGVVMRLVDPDTFGNVWIGMWWAIQTVTTVGYGDIVPGATAGKVIGGVMMLGGLSLLAVVTGAVSSAFFARAQEERRRTGRDPVMRRFDELESRLERIESTLGSGETGAGRRGP